MFLIETFLLQDFANIWMSAEVVRLEHTFLSKVSNQAWQSQHLPQKHALHTELKCIYKNVMTCMFVQLFYIEWILLVLCL